MPRVFISDKLEKAGLDILLEAGIEVDNRPGLKGDELKQAIRQADGMVVRSGTRLTAELLEDPGTLRAVVRGGVAVDNIDVAAATRKHPERLPGLNALRYMAGRTAGAIVRDAASLGGNTMLVLRHILNGTPFPSDMFTILSALGTETEWWTPTKGRFTCRTLDEAIQKFKDDPSMMSSALLVAYAGIILAAGAAILRRRDASKTEKRCANHSDKLQTAWKGD